MSYGILWVPFSSPVPFAHLPTGLSLQVPCCVSQALLSSAPSGFGCMLTSQCCSEDRGAGDKGNTPMSAPSGLKVFRFSLWIRKVLSRQLFLGGWRGRWATAVAELCLASEVGSPQTHGLLPEPQAPGPQVAGDTLRWELSELPRPLAPHLLFFPSLSDEFFKLLQ